MSAKIKSRPAPNATPAIPDLASKIAAQAELNVGSCGGDPISALNDAAIVNRQIPVYTYRQDPASPKHQPSFLAMLSLADVKAEGTGGSKPAAKREAARAWVKKCNK